MQGSPDVVPEQPELRREVERLRAHGAYDFTPVRPETVRALYGAQVSLSASRVDRFAACRYAFFLYDGLKAREWKQARFDAPVFGTFVHYVLEKTVRAVMERGGFAVVEEAEVLRLAQEHAQVYTQTYLPDLELPEQKEIGKYGLMRRTYLMNNRKGTYQAMLLKGTLNSHLAEIDETASRRLSEILPKMAKEAGATEELKATDQMAWVGMMNALKAQTEEMIISELIYS